MISIDKKAVGRAMRFYPRADELHHQGVEEFGGAWLGANEEIIAIARSWGINVSQTGARQLLPLIALRLLRHAKSCLKPKEGV